MSDALPPVPIEALLAHSAWARDLARRLVGEGEADEVLQETWLAALRRPPRAGGDPRPWLGRVLGSAARQRARRRRRVEAREAAAARDEALPSAAELAARAESQGLLIEAVLALDEPLRETLLLRYFEGLTGAEIARRSGVPAGTVRWRLHSALAELRAHLERRKGGGRGGWCAALAPLLGPRAQLAGAGGLPIPILGALAMKTLVLTSALAGSLCLVLLGVRLLGGGERADAPAQDLAFLPLPAASGSAAVDAADDPAQGSLRTALVAREPEPAGEAGGSAAEPLARLRLRLVDGQGAPIGGARVDVSPGSIAQGTHTGADGRAELAVRPLPGPGHHTLSFRRAGFANDSLRVSARAGEPIDLGDVVLRAGGAAEGVVVDGRGEPVAGVRVRVAGAQRVLPGGSMRLSETTALGASEARTDELGRFRLEGLLAGNVSLSAESDDRMWSGGRDGVEIRPNHGTRGVRIVVTELEAERRIVGSVVDPEGVPVPHAPIFVRGKTLWRSSSSLAVADAQGNFRVRLQWTGTWDLTARDPHDRFAQVERRGVRGGTRGLVLRFEPPRHARLRVLAADGSPIEDWTGELRVEDAGASVERLVPGPLRLPTRPFTLLVVAPGFDQRELGPFDPGQLVDAQVLDCTLNPLPGVRGRVSEAGAPAADVEVGLHALLTTRATRGGFPIWIEPDPEVRARTDADGRFELTLRAGGRYVVRAQVAGRAPAELGPFELEPGVGLSGLELELGAGGSIEGRVEHADGRPAVGRVVAASRGDGQLRTARAGPDGRYGLANLTPGRWLVCPIDDRSPGGGNDLSVDGSRPPHAELPWNCEVFEGAVTRFDLAGERRAGRLSGHLEAEGVEREGWHVELVPLAVAGPATFQETRLDADGRFAFELEVPGTYLLDITCPRGLRLLDEIEADGGALEWRQRLPVGRLELTNVPAVEPGRVPFVVWEGSGTCFALVPLLPDGEGRAAPDPVPAGSLRVVRPPAPGERAALAGEDPRAWPSLERLELPEGGLLRARLP